MVLKKTKGKQKIEMKKVNSYGDRMITFSKRKSGIYKKLNELVTMFNVKVAFLAFSESGKPYTFAHPSMEEVACLVRNPSRHELSAKDEYLHGPILESYKRQKIEEDKKKYEELVEEFEMDKEKEMKLKEMRDGNRIDLDSMWWNVPTGSLSVDVLKKYHQAFVDLLDAVQSLQGKDGGGPGVSSFGRA